MYHDCVIDKCCSSTHLCYLIISDDIRYDISKLRFSILTLCMLSYYSSYYLDILLNSDSLVYKLTVFNITLKSSWWKILGTIIVRVNWPWLQFFFPNYTIVLGTAYRIGLWVGQIDRMMNFVTVMLLRVIVRSCLLWVAVTVKIP